MLSSLRDSFEADDVLSASSRSKGGVSGNGRHATDASARIDSDAFMYPVEKKEWHMVVKVLTLSLSLFADLHAVGASVCRVVASFVLG